MRMKHRHAFTEQSFRENHEHTTLAKGIPYHSIIGIADAEIHRIAATESLPTGARISTEPNRKRLCRQVTAPTRIPRASPKLPEFLRNTSEVKANENETTWHPLTRHCPGHDGSSVWSPEQHAPREAGRRHATSRFCQLPRLHPIPRR
jgi:hypothetical protein